MSRLPLRAIDLEASLDKLTAALAGMERPSAAEVAEARRILDEFELEMAQRRIARVEAPVH